jgi:hypothetical protein
MFSRILSQLAHTWSQKNTLGFFTLFGLLYGAYAWVFLQSYLWASDNAWGTGAAPSELSDFFRHMMYVKFGLGHSYWLLPLLIGLLGFVLGILLTASKCDLALIWNALWFAARVTWRLRWCALLLLLLPVLGFALIGPWSLALPIVLRVIAVFFTGHIDSYRDATLFRLRWSAPGWFALLACCGLWVFSYFLDMASERWLRDGVGFGFSLSIGLGLELVLMQLCAGLWLTRCKDIKSFRILFQDSFRLARLRDTFAFEFLAIGGLFLVVTLPALAAAAFSIYEAAQLQSNLKFMGAHASFAFLFFTMSSDWMLSYWPVLITPLEVFLSIAMAKLWLEFQARAERESS